MDTKRQKFQMVQKGLEAIEDGVVSLSEKLGNKVTKKSKKFVSKLSPEHQEYQMVEQGLSAIADSLKAIDIPKPENGKDGSNGVDGVTPIKYVDYYTPEEQATLVQEVLQRIRQPEDGKDAEPVDYSRVEAFIASEVAKIPKPEVVEAQAIDTESIIQSVLALIPEQEPIVIDYPAIKDYCLKEIEKIENDREQRWTRLNSGGPTTRLGELVDVNTEGATVGSVIKWNGSEWVAGTDLGGVSTFIALTDVPNSYSGQAGKFPKVNAGETGLEFATVSVSTPSLQQVTDVGATTTNDISVPDEAYGAGWNGSLEVPTKNALYDKIETLGSGASIGGAMTSGTAGSVLFVDPNAIIAQNNQDFFWNNTLKNLLISSTLGSELLTNGTFTGNATGWTVPTGWAYSSNTVVHSSNGTGALQPSTALTTVIVGFEYQYSIDVSAMTVGTATLACGGVTLVAITADGTYTGKFVATSNANLTVTPTSTARFTVDNISLKRLSGGAIYAGSHVGDTHTAVKSALGTTTSAGFIAENTTLATSGVQQASPSYLRKGQGFLSNTSASFPFEVQDYVIGKVNITPYGQWINQWRGNGGSWTEFFSFDADPVGLGFNFTGSATSGSNPGSARFATFNNSGSNTWLDFKLGGTRRASFGVNNSGEITFNSTGDVINFTNSSNANLAQISTTGIINAGGSFNALRVTAGNATTTPPTTFSNYGSTSLQDTVITTNTTLNDDYTQVIVDCSSNNSCTGTPSVTACSTYTASGQATCESHLPCIWNAGSPCSAFNNEFGMTSCTAQSPCSADTSSCSGPTDQTACEAQDDTYGGNCTYDAGSNTCPSQTNTTACSNAGCTPDVTGDCGTLSDGGGDGTACATQPECSYDSGTGACSGNFFVTCNGDNTTPSCNGTFFTGNCSGTYGVSCDGTVLCSSYSTGACAGEAGCSVTSSVELTLPATPVAQTYWIAKDYTSGTLRILPNSGQTVNNTTSITSTSTAGVGWMLTWVESKSNWFIMSKH